MPNAGIDRSVRGDGLPARLSGSLMALVALATLLPRPLEVARALVGRAATGRAAGLSGDAALDGAALTVAAAAVWLMLGWASVVCGMAAVARVPGGLGRLGRAILRRIAPAGIRRVLIAGVGVTVLAGSAACAVEPVGNSSRPAAPSAVQVATAAPAPTAAPTSAHPRRATPPTGHSIAGGETRPGTAVRGVPFPTGAAESPDLDWPVQRPASRPDVDIDWPSPPAAPPSRAEQRATGPHSAEQRATAPHSAGPHTAGPHTAEAEARTSTPPPTRSRPTTRPGPPAHPDARRLGAPQSAAPRTGSPRVVIVHPGDSLWELAARDLGPGADDAHIDAAWPRWYAANREVIGGDPDLIEPGQRLQPPDTSHHTTEN